MALTPTESQQLTSLAQEVTRLTGTVDDLLTLVRSAGQGGTVDISTHNNSLAAHAALFANYTYLTANKTYYLSATGNDANDGTTVAKAKESWAGMHSLLAGIDPRGYTVTVQVSGKIAGSATFALPQFGPHNLNLVGSGTASDGFPGTMTASAGGFTPDKIAFGALLSRDAGCISATGKTIRLAAVGTNQYGFQLPSGTGKLSFYSCTIEYSGNFAALFLVYGVSAWLRQNTFVAVDGPVLTNFFFAGQGGQIVSYSNTWTGTATVTGDSISLATGGEVDINNPAAMPGGGTVICSLPGNINAWGTAAAWGYCSAQGAQGARNYNVTSITKSATGVYDIVVAAGSYCVVAGAGANPLITTATAAIGGTVTVRIFNASGVATDMGFYFAVY